MSGPVGGINHNRIPQPSGQPQADDLLPWMELSIYVILACAADIARPKRRQAALSDLHDGRLALSFAMLTPAAARHCRHVLEMATHDPAAYRAWRWNTHNQRAPVARTGRPHRRRTP